MKTLLFAILALLISPLPAQELVKDLNTTPGILGGLVSLHQVNEHLLGVFETSETGRELYSIDPSSGEVGILKDIYPGILSGLVFHGTNFLSSHALIGDHLYFGAYHPDHGHSIWRTTGESAGTEMMIPHLDAGIVGMASDGQKLLFFTSEPSLHVIPRKFALWNSDGTSAGTQKIYKGLSSRLNPADITFHNQLCYFFLFSSENNAYDLWRSDGTASGTFVIKDNLRDVGISDQVGGSSGGSLTFTSFGVNHGMGPNWYFLARDTTGVKSLWQTNGSQAGTTALANFGSSDINKPITVADVLEKDGNLYWLILSDSILHIWKSDGTAPGTQEIFSQGHTQPFGVSHLNIRHDSLLFLGPNDTQATSSSAIYQMDLQSFDTRRIQELDINVIFPSSRGNSRLKSQFYQSDKGPWFLSLGKGYSGRELWIADEETFFFQNEDALLNIGPETLFNGIFYSNSFLGMDGKKTLISHEGNLGIFQRWKDVENNSHGAGHYSAQSFKFRARWNRIPLTINADSIVIFNGRQDPQKPNLFKSNGTEGGTQLLADIEPNHYAQPTSFIPYKGKIIFQAATVNRGWEPYITDGTESGTQQIADTEDGPNAGGFGFTPIGDSLYFFGKTGSELWLSDGTYAGSKRISRLENTPFQIRRVWDMMGSNGKLYAFAEFYDTGLWELWQSGGTSTSTIRLDTDLVYPEFLGETPMGPLFINSTSEKGREVWISNGEVGGATMLKDLHQGPNSSNPREAIVYEGILYFTANDSLHGRELWRSDGTAEGTFMLKDVYPGQLSGVEEANFYCWKNKLYFRGNTEAHGTELWVTDGTEAGTKLLEDIVPGPQGSIPADFLGNDSWLFFAAWHPMYGVELHYTDGTNSSNMLWDLAEGPENSNPIPVAMGDKNLLFFADVDTLGFEVYVFNHLTTSRLKPLGSDTWTIYPNPAKDFLKLDMGRTTFEPLAAKIFSPNGSLIAVQEVQENSIDLRNLAPGLYMIQVRKGNTFYVGKFEKR